MPARTLLLPLLLVVALLSALALTWPAWQEITLVWWDDGTYSHGLLLAAVCLWLIWRDIRQHGWPAIQPDWRWLPALLLCALLFRLTLLASLNLPQRVLVLPLFLSLLGSVAGSAWLRRMLFPALLFSLALPIWGLLVAPLQLLAVAVVGSLLGLIDIPAVINDTHIRIAAGTFAVSQGCSGLRYLLVAAAVTLLWGHLYLRDWRTTLLYVLIGTLFALISNWLRILGLILIGHHTDMQHALMQDHNSFGWYIFAAALLPLFWIGRHLPYRQSEQTAPAKILPTTARPTAALLAMLALIAPTLLLQLDADRRVLHAPLPANGWQADRPQPQDWRPAFSGADQHWQLAYRQDPRRLNLHLFWYNLQRNDAELLGAGQTLLADGWTSVQIEQHCPPAWQCLVLRSGQRERVAMASYLVNGRLTASNRQAKLQQLLAPLSGNSAAALIAFDGNCNGDCEAALVQLIEDSAAPRHDLLSQLGIGEQP
jgi:EpsI family protein